LKSSGGKGVIVYGNFIKMILTTFKNLSLYGLAPKKNPLVPAHRAMACRKNPVDLCQYTNKVGEHVGEHRLPYN
jgi:hypothetical protein